MKQYIKWFTTPAILMIIFSCLPFFVQAQGPDPDVPIDGGLSLLLVAGVGYGVKKIRDSRHDPSPFSRRAKEMKAVI
jgi:hypothetical protein